MHAGDREAGVALLLEASMGYDKVLGKDQPDTITAAERLKDEIEEEDNVVLFKMARTPEVQSTQKEIESVTDAIS